MNGGHEATDDAELFIENLGNRGKAVGGAGSVGDDLLASVGLVVHAVHEHRSSVLRRSRHDDLLGTSLEVSRSEFFGEEEASGFNNDVYVKSAPSDVGRILFSEDLDLVAVDDEEVAFDLDVVVESAVDGVILQHVSEVVSVEKVVDTDNSNVLGEVFHSSAEDHTADTTETINTEFESHYWILFLLLKLLPTYTVELCWLERYKKSKFLCSTIVKKWEKLPADEAPTAIGGLKKHKCTK